MVKKMAYYAKIQITVKVGASGKLLATLWWSKQISESMYKSLEKNDNFYQDYCQAVDKFKEFAIYASKKAKLDVYKVGWPVIFQGGSIGRATGFVSRVIA